jgi:hypothetical protein
MMGPKFTKGDTDDAVAAIRKVYPAIWIELWHIRVKSGDNLHNGEALPHP